MTTTPEPTAPAYGTTTVVALPFADALAATRTALAGQGFGILTEIDMAATLKAKLDADIAPQVILGACNPPLAHRSLQAEPSIGLLLPCNVVVRSDPDDPQTTLVEAMNPQLLVDVTGEPQLQPIAEDVTKRLQAAIDALAAG